MRTFAELRDIVTAELAASEPRVHGRRAKVARLAQKLAAWEAVRKKNPRFRIRSRGASLTINEASLLKGGPTSLYLNVEVLGTRVGAVRFDTDKPATFEPADSFRSIEIDPSDAVLATKLKACLSDNKWNPRWSKNVGDAKLLSYFLRSARLAVVGKTRQDERIIQGLLNAALAGRKSGTPKAFPTLHGFRPVVPGAAMEIGTVLSTVAGGKNTGQADILVRHDAGADTEFLVFELKAPHGDAPASALTQAIRYALSLNAEANVDAETAAAYRRLFGSRAVRPLRFGAVAVIAEQHEEEARVALQSLCMADEMTVAVLLYAPVNDWSRVERLDPDRLRFLHL
jgi:hypothetical protein